MALVWFRLAVGGVVFWEIARAVRDERIERHFVEPTFHFGYGCARLFAPPGDPMVLYGIYAVLALASLGVVLGAFYRLSASTLALLCGYTFLFDSTYYLNHGYLIVLLATLAAFAPAHRAASVDVRLRGITRWETAPGLWLSLIRFHVALPYVFGGIAKLNADWLAGEPLLYWLEQSTHRVPLVGWALDVPWVGWAMVYGGVAFDLAVVPALLWRRTRRAAFFVAVTFHFLNSALFDIGVFPWLMIVLTALFFDDESLARWGHRVRTLDRRSWACGMAVALMALVFAPGDAAGAVPAGFVAGSLLTSPSTIPTRRRSNRASAPRTSSATKAIAMAYCGMHLVLPFRAFAYAGNPLWTEQGMMFSWRMMLREKLGTLQLRVEDVETGRSFLIDPADELEPEQADRIIGRPDMMVCYARELRRRAQRPVRVYAASSVSLHERTSQPLVRADVDLADENLSLWGEWTWVEPLREPEPRRSVACVEHP